MLMGLGDGDWGGGLWDCRGHRSGRIGEVGGFGRGRSRMWWVVWERVCFEVRREGSRQERTD